MGKIYDQLINQWLIINSKYVIYPNLLRFHHKL